MTSGLPVRGFCNRVFMGAVVFAAMSCGSRDDGDLLATPSGNGPGTAATGGATQTGGSTGSASKAGTGGSGANPGTGGTSTGSGGANNGGSGATSGGDAICSLPIVVGPCEAAFPRFAFSASEGQCVPFTYGGCEGNENNFETLEDCEATCGGASGSGGSGAAPGTGGSGAAPGTGGSGAKPGTGGSGANPGTGGSGANPGTGGSGATPGTGGSGAAPSTGGAAGATGEGGAGAACSLPIDVGPCDGAIPRFAYSESAGRCLPFSYGGCQGNENNFETLEECEAACGGTLSQCPEHNPDGEDCDEGDADLACTYDTEDCLCAVQTSTQCLKVDPACPLPSHDARAADPAPGTGFAPPRLQAQHCTCSEGTWECKLVF